MWGKPNEGTTPSMPNPNNTTASGPITAPSSNSSATVFGKTMKIVGEVISDDDLQLDGELEGNLNLKSKLTIGPGSKVNANIKAREIVVFGTVKGNVEAENRISLRTGASIVGDIKTAGIVIEDGAYFKGGIDISRGEAEKTPAKAAAAGNGQKR
jgi:cytoskeletal protein CcmA (bactofilin family)